MPTKWQLTQSMKKISQNSIQVASPGRINLIGEHIDYNDGFVLPAAIDKCIYMTLKANGSNNRCTIKSKGFDSILVIDLDQMGQGTEGWHNYVLGVVHEIQKRTKGLRGFDCHMESKVPVGSGVSSSAALECGLAFGLNALFDLGLDDWDLITIGQQAEHNFVGTQCGIMDQFASVMGKTDHTMLLDCRSLEFEYIPANISPYQLLLLNTNVAHNLSSGEYNVRRRQCNEGLAILVERFGLEKSFRSVSLEMLLECKEKLGALLFNRCSYVVEEMDRVLQAVKALKNKDIKKLGTLMYQTHDGLRRQYEVSCPELDFLVDFSKGNPHVLGSRMMGGGFGGCTLNIVHESAVSDFVRTASEAYKTKFNIDLSHFQAVPSQGTHIMKQSL